MSLAALMTDFGTDKAEHDYAGVYEDWLAPYADAPIVLLELGAGFGASLRVWKRWLPHARVYGVDREADSLSGFTADGVFIGDQRDSSFLSGVIETIGAPDVVIDDGGHLSSEQIDSFQILFPKLRSGGLYVVEDAHVWYADVYRDRDPDAREFFLGLVDAVNVAGRGMTGSFEQALSCSGEWPAVPALAPLVGAVEFRQSLVAVRPR